MLWSIFLATVVFKASRVLAATTIPPSLEGYYWDSTSSTCGFLRVNEDTNNYTHSSQGWDFLAQKEIPMSAGATLQDVAQTPTLAVTMRPVAMIRPCITP